MRNIQEANLAWALIEATKPHLTAGERNHVFVTVGAGDTFATIGVLLNLAAAKGISWHPHLVQLCRSWVDGYAFHDQHQHLRGLIEDCLRPNAVQPSPATGRASTMKPPPLLTIRHKLRTRRVVPAG
jgi:hypothetical protein